MTDSSNGFEIKATKKRGGHVRNINIRDSKFSRILMHSVNYNDDGEAANDKPEFTDCRFSNVMISGRYLDEDKKKKSCNAIEIIGFDEPELISNIYFDRVGIYNRSNIVVQNCSNVNMNRISTYL